MRISIVIPAYNEEKNLGSLLDDVIKLRNNQKWNCEIIIVNDNSKDKTAEIAGNCARKHSNIEVIHRKDGNNGMGFSLIEGTKKCSGDTVVWLMADKSDNLNSIISMIRKLNESSDMVFGSRYMNGGSRGDLPLIKAFLSGGYTFFSRLIFGIKVHDITNAFRCFKKEVFNKIPLQSGDYAISPEFAIKAHLSGFKLDEVPAIYKDRKGGKSNFELLKMGIKYIKLFKYALKKKNYGKN